MKKFFMLAGLFCFLAMPVLAQEVLEITGTIIDNECLEAHKADPDFAAYVKAHTKECALKAGPYSGYSIYTPNNKAYKFDAQSTAQIEDFLKKEDSKLDVVVEVQQFTDDLTLVSIKNQEEKKE